MFQMYVSCLFNFFSQIYYYACLKYLKISDRDPIFTGNFWTKLFSYLGAKLAHSSSYHRQLM